MDLSSTSHPITSSTTTTTNGFQNHPPLVSMLIISTITVIIQGCFLLKIYDFYRFLF